MNDRFNTIAGWVLGGGIVLLGGMLVAGEMFSDHSGAKGYPIEGVVEEGAGGAAAADPPIAALLASADPGRGAQLFKQCAACHTITNGGANGLGPNLWGVLGKPHGHLPNFAYSDALKSKEGNWDWEQMNQWLRSPRAYAPGTKMTFAGLSDPQGRADLILYINQQGSNLPLPAPPAAAPAEGNAAGSGNAAAPANGAAPANATAPANAGQPRPGADPTTPARGGGEAKEGSH
jgi:cytochrome c